MIDVVITCDICKLKIEEPALTIRLLYRKDIAGTEVHLCNNCKGKIEDILGRR